MSKRIFQIECCKAFKNRWFFISLIISGVFAFCGAYIMISNYFLGLICGSCLWMKMEYL